MKTTLLLLTLVLAGGCASGGGSGSGSPGPATDPATQPLRPGYEPSACGTLYGYPVQCVPSQRAAIDAAMSQAENGSMPSAETFEALGMYPPPGAQRTSTSPARIDLKSSEFGGFNYQSFGVWESQVTSNLNNYSNGQVTPAAAVPGSGTASFTGKLLGVYVSPAGTQEARANVRVDADFSSRSLAFTSGNTSLQSGAMPYLDLKGTLTYAPGSASFTGTVKNAGGSMSGSSHGTFYGPKAEELGGVFDLASPRGVERFSGAYGAKR